jgi:hypothetical protein
MPREFSLVFSVTGLEKFSVGCCFLDSWIKGTIVFN